MQLHEKVIELQLITIIITSILSGKTDPSLCYSFQESAFKLPLLLPSIM